MSLTAEEVRRVEFGNAPIGRRGYAKNEVDAFVRRIAKTLEGEDDLTAAEVHHVMFDKPLLGKRGYDEREVDEFLERAEDTLATFTSRAHPLPKARTGAEPGVHTPAPGPQPSVELSQS
ncbi:DivIVA domain-containing protein [Amycolatopsis bartoniae]|uniref:Cell wall synthesis protein Wag31 n=1 Tax=Amycolatopsis bartoniae TaxID=941986 RepID=A0A8H9IPU3_9PSEU|nr:DivIVA domain-containing protein [Amycolatopsis bartoniae]MBB2934722.1 DivIVA domain-containing protein [Amycolatopsis bartoniae]TVT09369.1 DivIVA domain-containing protein [Amycolatopsis bartoniae]GHF45245.1 DivIVA domain-containing protein [Amycolatopsis bartoniae]